MVDAGLKREEITTLTFDCYGTLIDWRRGLNDALRAMFEITNEVEAQRVYQAYVPVEMEVESEGYRPYREVLGEAAFRLGRSLGTEVSRDRAGDLARSLPTWPPFEDTVEALARLKSGFRLGILSNIDRDLFAKTARVLGTDFDFVITAEDVGSYKPAAAHFKTMLADHASRQEVLHVAQSLLHDGVPAGELRIAYAWINRYGEPNETDVVPSAEFATLSALADALGV